MLITYTRSPNRKAGTHATLYVLSTPALLFGLFVMKKKICLSKTRFYNIRRGITYRCNNVNCKYYKDYWWRWITNTRITFKEFKRDMYNSYVKHVKQYWIKQTTIDRINNNWNYCKSNCRWATLQEQRVNQRNTILMKYWYDVNKLCIEYNLTTSTMKRYIRKYKENLIQYLNTKRKWERKNVKLK